MLKKLWILGLCTLIFACDSKDDDNGSSSASAHALATQSLGGDLASLLPGDANVLIFVRSLAKTETMLTTIGDLTEQPLPFSPGQLVQQMTGVDPATLDASKPLAVAVKLVRMGMVPQPTMTFVLPVSDPAAVAKASGLPAKEIGNGYVALSQDEQYAAAGSKLAAGLPEGDFVLRADIGALVTMYKADIDGMMMMGEGLMQGQLAQQAPGADVAAMAANVFGFAKDFINSAEYFDLSLTDRDPTMVTDMVFTAKEGSALGGLKSETNLLDLAEHLPQNHDTTILYKFDFAGMQDWISSLTEMAAKELDVPDANEKVRAMQKDLQELVKGMGADFAFSLKPGPAGVQLVGAFRAPDAPTFAGRYIDFMTKHSLGVAWKTGEKTEVGGTTVYNGVIQFDEKVVDKKAVDVIFDKDGLAMSMAGKGDRVVAVLGKGATTIEAALGGNERNAGLAAALEEATGNVGFLVQTDIRAVVRDFASMLTAKGERAPKVKDGAAVPFMVFGTRNGRAFRIGVRFDVAPLKAFVEEMQRGN